MRKIITKKRFLFPIIFLGEFVALSVIANIFGFETSNSLYALIAIYILFSTLVVFLIIIVREHKTELAGMKIPFASKSVLWDLYFVIGLTIVALIILLPLTIMDLLR